MPEKDSVYSPEVRSTKPGPNGLTRFNKIRFTMIRVQDLEKSIDFYTRFLGMDCSRRIDYPKGRYTVAMLGYGYDFQRSEIQLTQNWDRTEPYDLGNGFGHFVIQVLDVHALCRYLESEGVKITRPPGPMKFGGGHNMAFIEDPDGYRIELAENRSGKTKNVLKAALSNWLPPVVLHLLRRASRRSGVKTA